MSQNTEDKTSIWKEFSIQTNGTFKEGYSWHSDSVEITHKKWTIIFDNYTLWSGKYSSKMTRIIVPISLKDNFRFEIYPEELIRKIEKIFGVQDIEIGYPEFDKAFIVKSNNEFKIKSLLRNANIRNLLLEQKNLNIQLSNQNGIWEQPKNQFELSYYIDGEIHNVANLIKLLELFKIILDELFQINTIS